MHCNSYHESRWSARHPELPFCTAFKSAKVGKVAPRYRELTDLVFDGVDSNFGAFLDGKMVSFWRNGVLRLLEKIPTRPELA